MMFSRLAQTICRHEEGQMLVEYLLLLSLLVVVVLLAFNTYVGPLGSLYAAIEEAFNAVTNGVSL